MFGERPLSSTMIQPVSGHSRVFGRPSSPQNLGVLGFRSGVKGQLGIWHDCSDFSSSLISCLQIRLWRLQLGSYRRAGHCLRKCDTSTSSIKHTGLDFTTPRPITRHIKSGRGCGDWLRDPMQESCDWRSLDTTSRRRHLHLQIVHPTIQNPNYLNVLQRTPG